MTTLRWNLGSGYDLFISLMALHRAGDFGLRPSWTAGVRQRLTLPRREFLERVFSFAGVPLDWISSLPGSLDALPVLHAAAELGAAECLRRLTLPGDTPQGVVEALTRVADRGWATDAERELVVQRYTRRGKLLKSAELDLMLEIWSNASGSGGQLIASLQEYYQVFFAEEETRIRPALEAGLEHARERSGRLKVSALVEELSRGVHFEGVESAQEIILVPSFWSTPLVFQTIPAEGRMQVVFGCRPELESVAPGAETPDRLMLALKSLADPTRLCILRYLSGELLTPTELSHRLRLRPPTVLHHLHALRLAELVAIRVSGNGEKRYTARSETLQAVFTAVSEFVRKE
jgi:DNA-binding transcriptional ArsR family regulator